MLRKTLLALAVTTFVAPPLAAQTLDELIAKYVEAKGGLDKLKALKSIRLTGIMTIGPGMEAPVVVELKRPNLMRVDFTVQGMTGTQAYDGGAGWTFMPFAGQKSAEPMSPEDLKVAEEQADIDGALVDYEAKGHQVELMGKEKVEGTDAHKVKVTMKNGTVRYIYLDAEYFLEIREEGERIVRGTEVDSESSIGDYKEVDGLMFPHSVESGPKGSPQKQKMTVQKIELNVPIDDARFKMPSKPQ